MDYKNMDHNMQNLQKSMFYIFCIFMPHWHPTLLMRPHPGPGDSDRKLR